MSSAGPRPASGLNFAFPAPPESKQTGVQARAFITDEDGKFPKGLPPGRARRGGTRRNRQWIADRLKERALTLLLFRFNPS